MFDAALRPWVDRILNPVGIWLAARNVGANTLTAAGFGVGIAAVIAVALGYFWLAFILIIINRIFDGLDGAVARATKITDFGGFLDITSDFIFYSAVPFGFVLVDPGNGSAGCFLVFSFVGSGASFLAFAIIAEKRGILTETQGKKAFFYVGGLTEGTETIIFLLTVTALPQLFVPLALIFGVLCWVTTANRVWSAAQLLSTADSE
ncbi:CDP-alcohol phosphatidyltransferase family protein [Alphaproteobacteria bacterium]|jgi:phosphatidylglycerophosphate synthase|nr:CDP-alcohol phosphatidyltransferase family protein [Alphaproteobacteria bacterium]